MVVLPLLLSDPSSPSTNRYPTSPRPRPPGGKSSRAITTAARTPTVVVRLLMAVADWRMACSICVCARVCGVWGDTLCVMVLLCEGMRCVTELNIKNSNTRVQTR